MGWGSLGWRPWRALVVAAFAALVAAAAIAPAQAQNPSSTAATSKVKTTAGKPAAKVAPRAKKAQNATRAPAPAPANRYAAVIVDEQTGRILHDANGQATRFPASLTKAMTLYMAFEALEQGRLRMDQRLPVSGWASIQSPTKFGLKEGDTITVRDVIYGLIAKSANDAAVVMAEALAGDEDVFAQRMTQRARQLGMKSTTFRNASGLPNPQQVTTAYDMALMAMAIRRDFPTFYPMFATQEHSYGGRIHTNHNRMLGWYNGAEGLKTGYTNASGFNLVLIANRDGRRLVGVVMGGRTGQSRDTHMAELMDKGFAALAGGKVPATARVIQPNAKPAFAGSTVAPMAQARAAATAAPAPVVPPTFTELPPPRAAQAALPPNPFAPPAASSAQTDQGGEPVQYAMQVGAFSNADAARRAIALAQLSLPDMRGNASISPIERSGRTLYRARIIGLPESDAALGCRRLKDSAILDCSVVRVDPDDIDIAAN